LKYVAFDFMLPKAEYDPSLHSKFPKVPLVPFPVPGNLMLPEVRHLVLPRREAIAMPEVAIHEDGNLG